VLVAVALAVAVALSVDVGRHQRVGQDFHVFWQAGHNFATGHPLYHDSLPGARPLKYPPFAALVFQPLALFPLQVAGALFSLLNLFLWVAAVWLTRDIVARVFPERARGAVPLVLAVLLSAQFFLDNFHHAQMNGVIFVLVLLGIRAALEGRGVRAAAFTVAATAIKITPIFFVAWLMLRGRRRAALAVLPLALACILIPMMLRGPATGAAELVEYYHVFLQGHQHGEISDYTGGQNIAGLVNRMTLPVNNPQQASYRWLPLSEPDAQLAYRILWAAVMLVFLAQLVRLRRRRAGVSALELAMVFLAGLLLSPITFTTHLVSLLFVFLAFLSVRPASLSPAMRPVAVLLCLAMAVIGLSGRDLAGDTAYEAVGGYSLYAWTMLALFATAVLAVGSGRRAAAGSSTAVGLGTPESPISPS
jgi:glycosyl transferase family 87